MSDLKDILGLPKEVDGLGKVYPIKVIDYEDFLYHSNFLRFTKKHFNKEIQELPLFHLINLLAHEDEQIIHQFINMLKMITKKDFYSRITDDELPIYVSDDGSELNAENYDQFRRIVMRQNLIYEDRVFKSKTVKQWADKVLKARQENSVDMTMEDMISVVHVFTSAPFEQIANYTIYQLHHIFQRILKVEDYRKQIQFLCASGDSKIKIDPFMEKIDLYKHPYDDVFVDKSKLSSLNNAIN